MKPWAKSIRPIRVVGEVAFVTLTKGYVAIIDAADVPLAEGRNWSALIGPSLNVYAATGSGGPEGRLLHRVIVGARRGEFVDHIRGDTLNNRRSNLRLCSRVGNNQNAGVRIDNVTGFRGVSIRENGRYRARIQANGRMHQLGTYETPEEAAAAFERAARELHGEFAPKEARMSAARLAAYGG